MSPILQVLTFLTGILFAVSLSAGIYGFLLGSRLGGEALVGIRQPDSSTSAVWRDSTAKQRSDGATPVPFVAESDVIKRVKEKTAAPIVATPTPNASPKASPQPATPASATGSFPYYTQNQGVYLEVLSLKVEDETLNLDVSLRNEGTQAVRFLYSFLTVTDNRGQSLSSSIEGLPSELPAVSETFTGRIRVPRITAETLESINLELMDYPDQQIKLKIEDIPVSAQN